MSSTEHQMVNLTEEEDAKKSPIPEPSDDTSDTTPERWLNKRMLAILLITYILFIPLGGVIFHFIESSNEQTSITLTTDMVHEFFSNHECLSQEDLSKFITKIITAHDQGIVIRLPNDTNTSPNSKWDFISSVFFSTTIVTTIGYGNITPSTKGGRVFSVFFALLGIPLFIITSEQVGMRISKFSEKIARKALRRVSSEVWRPLLSIFIVFIIGFSIFFLAAAGVFTAVEGWTFGESMYYAFVTLTTIGFGDYYPEFANGGSGGGNAVSKGFYRALVSVWIIFGLAWMASTMTAISDAINQQISRRMKKSQEITKKQDRLLT